MPNRERDLPKPIFLPPKTIPLEPAPDPEMGPFPQFDRLVTQAGIVLNRRGRIMRLEVVGLSNDAVEAYTSEVRIAFGYQRSRRRAPAGRGQPGRESRSVWVERDSIRADLGANPNNLIILLDFAGALQDPTAKILALARNQYREGQSVWRKDIAAKLGIELQPPSLERFDLGFVIDPPISAQAEQKYQRMQAKMINLVVDVVHGDGSVTARLLADGQQHKTPQTIQKNGLAVAEFDHTSDANHSIYQLVVTGGANGGIYQVTGLWKDFVYVEQFADVASKGTVIV